MRFLDKLYARLTGWDKYGDSIRFKWRWKL